MLCPISPPPSGPSTVPSVLCPTVQLMLCFSSPPPRNPYTSAVPVVQRSPFLCRCLYYHLLLWQDSLHISIRDEAVHADGTELGSCTYPYTLLANIVHSYIPLGINHSVLCRVLSEIVIINKHTQTYTYVHIYIYIYHIITHHFTIWLHLKCHIQFYKENNTIYTPNTLTSNLHMLSFTVTHWGRCPAEY